MNTKNPGSLIPILLSLAFLKNDYKNLEIFEDELSFSKKIPNFSLEKWMKANGKSNIKISSHKNKSFTLSIFNPYLKLEIVE